jgi:hypothetical protein
MVFDHLYPVNIAGLPVFPKEKGEFANRILAEKHFLSSYYYNG